MKIGILTLPFNNNYGGYLQAYALMTILKKFGHDVELIYRRQEIKKRTLKSDLKFFIKRSLKSIITRKHYPLFYNYEREYKCDGEKMVQFSNQYIIPKTNAIYTSYELESECGSRFDAIIVGSDQVWRPIFVPNIQDFFLHFVKNNYTKKIAYAASFGTSNPEYSEEQIKLCGDLLCQFDAVSVREDSGIDVIKKFGWNCINPSIVLDPTMLLEKSFYEKLMDFDLDSLGKGKIVTYLLDKKPEKNIVVAKVAKKLSLQIYNINNKTISIPQWLRTIHDADFVITDSFHGTVFSVIFNVPFIVIPNQKRGTCRFNSLLKLFNLESRIVNLDENNISHILINDIINWSSVNNILINEREKAFAFLLKSLENE